MTDTLHPAMAMAIVPFFKSKKEETPDEVKWAAMFVEDTIGNLKKCELYDTKIELEALITAIRKYPEELINKLNKSIETLEEKMLKAEICPKCGVRLDWDGNLKCHECGFEEE